jgi:hypothetical protein
VKDAILQVKDVLTVEELARNCAPVEVRGREVACCFPTRDVGSGEVYRESLVLEFSFVLDYVLMDASGGDGSGLDGFQVLDLCSGHRSLFTTPGSFPASLFGVRGRGPTFGSVVTLINEPVVLKVVNQSGKKKIFSAVAVGKCFEKCFLKGSK